MMGTMTRRGIILFAALGLIWGIPYLFIKVAVTELTPEFLVLARTALAAAILLPIAAGRGAIRPVLRRWKPLLAFAVVEIVLPWYFLNSAEQRLPSSTTALLMSVIPLVAAVVALAFGRRDRITPINAIGMLLGMLGVATIVGFDVEGSDLGSVAKLIVVVIGFAVGPAILARWMSDLPGVGVIGVALAATAVLTVPIVAITGGWPRTVPSAPVVVSVFMLAAVGTGICYLLLFALVAEIGPIRMTAVSYVNPAVAVVAGALVLQEEITAWAVAGFALIVLGCVFVTRPDVGREVAREPAPLG
jgi:drug/metabolite transporter (DMT)-like permease